MRAFKVVFILYSFSNNNSKATQKIVWFTSCHGYLNPRAVLDKFATATRLIVIAFVMVFRLNWIKFWCCRTHIIYFDLIFPLFLLRQCSGLILWPFCLMKHFFCVKRKEVCVKIRKKLRNFHYTTQHANNRLKFLPVVGGFLKRVSVRMELAGRRTVGFIVWIIRILSISGMNSLSSTFPITWTRMIFLGRIKNFFSPSSTLNPRPRALDWNSLKLLLLPFGFESFTFNRPRIRNCAYVSNGNKYKTIKSDAKTFIL